MDKTKQQLVDAVKSAENILVTVSNNPSVDELSAALGLTIILNNLDKRASAVFSGATPPAITFLEPNKTFETSAESLRDFIIALDKEKADHLRYKVEGDVVKIFITPYKRVLTEKDLAFSQGDYNVELVIALGVTDQSHLDKALEAQGKILHSATVVTVTTGKDTSSLGSLDWHDAKASSLSEMIVGLVDELKGDQPVFDQQTATALLTGIVSATERFSNDKTTSVSMTMAAQLMAAGANQQLIAAKLEEAHDIVPGSPVVGGDVKGASGLLKDNVLTIDRTEISSSSDKSPPPDIKNQPGSTTGGPNQAVSSSTVAQPQQNQPATDAKQQQEFEKQLQGVTASPAATMADIEKQLQEEATKAVSPVSAPVFAPPAPQPPEPTVPAPQAETIVPPPPPVLSPVLNMSAAPVIDQSEVVVTPPVTSVPAPEPQSMSPQAPTDLSTPETPEAAHQEVSSMIVNNHGGAYSAPLEQPVLNATVGDPNEGEPPSVNPFDTPSAEPKEPLKERMEVQPLNPITTTTGSAPVSTGIPELPPLPPLPGNSSLPPLPPPPPPPPVVGQQPTVSFSGAVTGDIFGDGVTGDSLANTAVPVSTNEPGQYRIPGSVV